MGHNVSKKDCICSQETQSPGAIHQDPPHSSHVQLDELNMRCPNMNKTMLLVALLSFREELPETWPVNEAITQGRGRAPGVWGKEWGGVGEGFPSCCESRLQEREEEICQDLLQ